MLYSEKIHTSASSTEPLLYKTISGKKIWLFVKVEIKKKCYWNCWLSPSIRLNLQIKPHPTRWQYPLINYRILHEAARDGELHLVKYLHQSGANLTTKNNKGTTPILLAAINGHFRVVKYLHKHGYLGKIDIAANKNGTKSLKEIHLNNHFPISVRIHK